jgi:hypothetical protein
MASLQQQQHAREHAKAKQTPPKERKLMAYAHFVQRQRSPPK